MDQAGVGEIEEDGGLPDLSRARSTPERPFHEPPGAMSCCVRRPMRTWSLMVREMGICTSALIVTGVSLMTLRAGRGAQPTRASERAAMTRASSVEVGRRRSKGPENRNQLKWLGRAERVAEATRHDRLRRSGEKQDHRYGEFTCSKLGGRRDMPRGYRV